MIAAVLVHWVVPAAIVGTVAIYGAKYLWPNKGRKRL